jgi:DNA-binding NtrC family response regulator
VRFIAATNRDLAGEIACGRFRQDLFFRLNGIMLAVPPLRERIEEIVPLAHMFAAKAARNAGRGEPHISNEALALLRAYSWPGNVRELRNVMERAVLLCAGDEIRAEHLPGEKMVPLLPVRPSNVPPSARSADADDMVVTEVRPQSRVPPSKPSTDTVSERDRIRKALDECGGNQTHAARLLGISRGTLIARIQQHEIPRPRKR